MAIAFIEAGICGFTTRVSATQKDGFQVSITIESDCPSVQAFATRLTTVDPIREISYRGDGPQILAAARETLPHPACPVPSAVIKCVEVATGLALPKDAGIKFVE